MTLSISLYIFVLFETIQFVGYPFLLLLAFFLISFSFFFWYPLHHPAVLVKSEGWGSRFTWLFLCKSNPEHTCLSILIILPINLFSLVCFSLLVWYIIIIIIFIYFLLLVWYRIRHQAKADSRNNCVAPQLELGSQMCFRVILSSFGSDLLFISTLLCYDLWTRVLLFVVLFCLVIVKGFKHCLYLL